MKASTNHVLRTSPRAMALAVLAATSLPAAALEFSTDAGWNGSVNTTLSASASWGPKAATRPCCGKRTPHSSASVAPAQPASHPAGAAR